MRRGAPAASSGVQRPGAVAVAAVLALGSLPPASPARAVTVSDGVSARLTPDGFAFVADAISGVTIAIPSIPMTFEFEALGCDYTVDVYGYTGTVDVGEVSISAVAGSPDQLWVQGTLDHVEVRDMVVEAVTPDWWCFNYNEEDHDVIVSVMSTSGVGVDLRIAPEVSGGALSLEVLQSSDVDLGSVEVVTTPWYIPDSLLEYTLELFQADLEQTIEDSVAELAGSTLFDLPLDGALRYVGYGATVTDMEMGGGGLNVVVDTSISYTGPPGECAGGTPEGPLTPGEPRTLSGNAGDLQLSMTEEQVNASVGMVWASGLLCQEFERLDLTSLTPLFPVLDGDVGVLDFRWEVIDQPWLSLEPDGLGLELSRLGLTLSTAGEGQPLMWAEASVSGLATLSLDDQTQAVALTVQELEIEFTSLEAEPLLQGTNYTEEAFLDLVDDQVMPLVMEQMVELDVMPMNYALTGLSSGSLDFLPDAIGGRITAIDLFEGSIQLVVDATFDPDLIPPQVEIVTDLSQPSRRASWTIEYRGEDDRSEPLVYSWRLDERPWSGWSTSTSATLTVSEGPHVFEVRVRDSYWNQGDIAAAEFQRLDEPVADDDAGCACRGEASPPLPVAWPVLLGLAWLARRAPGRRTRRRP